MKREFKICVALAVAMGWVVAIAWGQTVSINGYRVMRGISSPPSNGQVAAWNSTTGQWDPAANGSGGGGGSAPVGTMVNTTATTAGQVFVAADTTKTNATPASTLTGIRITQRVATLADAATVTPDVDSFDGGKLTTLSQTTTIANPTGTPTALQRYILRIKSTTTRVISFGAQYRGSLDLALPTSTSGSSLTDYLVFQYNSDDTKWDLVGKNFGF